LRLFVGKFEFPKQNIAPSLNNTRIIAACIILFTGWLINLFSISFGKITALSSRLPSAFAGIGSSIYGGKEYTYQILFIQEKDFNKVSKLLEIPMFVLEKDSVGHRDMLFISNIEL
jgi:hypothetical protein